MPQENDFGQRVFARTSRIFSRRAGQFSGTELLSGVRSHQGVLHSTMRGAKGRVPADWRTKLNT